MAISKKGNHGFTGKVGKTVTYRLNGKWVQREIGISNKPATDRQLASRQITAIISKFLSSVREFINVGFVVEAKRARKSANNMATSFNRSNAITGNYPDQRIDFSKVLLSMGKMPLNSQVKAELTNDGITFSWDTSLTDDGRRWSDQAMLMAYMPEINEAAYLINGARRTVGTDLLRLPIVESPVLVETYISFISANHKSVSDSIYTGQLIWDGLKLTHRD